MISIEKDVFRVGDLSDSQRIIKFVDENPNYSEHVGA